MTDKEFQEFVHEELTVMKLEINVMAETIYQLMKLVKEDMEATQSTMCQLEKIVIGLVRNTPSSPRSAYIPTDEELEQSSAD